MTENMVFDIAVVLAYVATLVFFAWLLKWFDGGNRK